MPKRALITGITGQDGAYLSRLLLEKGYLVFGTYRPTSSLNTWRLRELGIADHPQLTLLEHDLTDLAGTYGLLNQSEPDEVYNLAAQSFVGLSFKQPVATAHVTAIGPLNLLEAIRLTSSKTRYYQASSSEMFGGASDAPQGENSPLSPRSPYAASKCFAHWTTMNYREAYGLYAVSGILFNHESPLRSLDFVTRKISDSVARIRLGIASSFMIGNLDAQRDWGYASEFAAGIWSMLQADRPNNYVLATGRAHSVRQFVQYCFENAQMPIRWVGAGVAEKGVDLETGEVRVQVDPSLYRPSDPARVVGDASLAARELGWHARTDVRDLCGLMLTADIKRHLLRKES